jgi:hypothetical protein
MADTIVLRMCAEIAGAFVPFLICLRITKPGGQRAISGKSLMEQTA